MASLVLAPQGTGRADCWLPEAACGGEMGDSGQKVQTPTMKDSHGDVTKKNKNGFTCSPGSGAGRAVCAFSGRHGLS